jgi:hypothetical protein
MYASVELVAGGETMVLPARNISLGGVFLAADGHDLGALQVGGVLEVQVFNALDESHRPVRLHARVLRHDANSMALMWTSEEPHAARELARLLETLQPKPKADE